MNKDNFRVTIMLTYRSTTALLVLFSSMMCVSIAHAEAQSNRHSYSADNSFSFEQHASDYLNSNWTPDNEVSIDEKTIKILLPFMQQAKQSEQQQKAKQLNYEAKLSDKSFGVSATFHF